MHAQLLLWEENKGMNGQRKTMRPSRKASANVQNRVDGRI
jgi:hypothetical protein